MTPVVESGSRFVGSSVHGSLGLEISSSRDAEFVYFCKAYTVGLETICTQISSVMSRVVQDRRMEYSPSTSKSSRI